MDTALSNNPKSLVLLITDVFAAIHEEFEVRFSPLSFSFSLHRQFEVNRQTLAGSVRSFRSTVTKVALKYCNFAFDKSDFKSYPDDWLNLLMAFVVFLDPTKQIQR